MMRSSLNRESVDSAKAKFIAERISFAEKLFADFSTGFSEYSRKILRLSDKHDELAKIFKYYAENEAYNRTFSEGLRNFSKALTILGDFKEMESTRIDTKVSSEFQQYEGTCKSTKDDLKGLFALKEKEMHRKKQMEQIRHRNQRGYHKNHAALDGEIKKLKTQISQITKKINGQIENFERAKLKFAKEILLNFIKIEMKQHARAIEVLTAAYQDFYDIDEDDDLNEFKKMLNFNEREPCSSGSLSKHRRNSLVSQSTTSLNTNGTQAEENIASSNDDISLRQSRSTLKKGVSMDELSNETSASDEDEETMVPQIKILKSYCEGVEISSTDDGRSITSVKPKTIYVVKSINGVFK